RTGEDSSTATPRWPGRSCASYSRHPIYVVPVEAADGSRYILFGARGTYSRALKGIIGFSAGVDSELWTFRERGVVPADDLTEEMRQLLKKKTAADSMDSSWSISVVPGEGIDSKATVSFIAMLGLLCPERDRDHGWSGRPSADLAGARQKAATLAPCPRSLDQHLDLERGFGRTDSVLDPREVVTSGAKNR